ncbi:protein BIG GRAIN 1-like E [Prosopis cineraria]|uniref:protein BIG GRAIN 1-like E n=1 Tax=Prosopis cineraria TaxID=364024 RepID=UPI00241036D8|nr:protein BIG GRAIN 1-like E [Prosopis cineraria]
MSMAGLIDSEKNHKVKSFHRRNDSGELDVFEAARYFSGYNEAVGYHNNDPGVTQKIMREDQRNGHKGRISLDMPMRNLFPQQFHGVAVEKQIMKEKKHKQPSSPGGRLASFLNSLFSQSSSKKKKSKSSSQSMKDDQDDQSPGGRRRRRSSISHFRSSSSTATTATTSDSKSLYSSFSSVGFRTPPHIHTPTKSCKEFRTLSKYDNSIENLKSFTFHNDQLSDDHKKKNENFKYSNGVLEKHRNWGNELSEKEFRKFNVEVDDDDGDGAESDSSSDLFELQNYDLGYCSSGLPVYETTNMDNIKRGAPISNGAL